MAGTSSWLFKDFRPEVGDDNVLLVYYERLKQDTPRELRRIKKFLQLDNVRVCRCLLYFDCLVFDSQFVPFYEISTFTVPNANVHPHTRD